MAVHLRPGGGDAEQEPGASRGARRRRARLETASKAQRETGEAMLKLQRRVEELQAAAREKDAEVGRLRAEAAGARTKLQEAHQVTIHLSIAMLPSPLWISLGLALADASYCCCLCGRKGGREQEGEVGGGLPGADSRG